MPFVLHTQCAKSLGGEPRFASCSFAPNGMDDPLVASNHGPPGLRAFTTVYAATGQYTITFPEDCRPPTATVFQITAQAADLTGYFEVMQTGAYDATTGVLVVQAKRAGSGNAPAAAAGCRIHISMFFNDSGV